MGDLKVLPVPNTTHPLPSNYSIHHSVASNHHRDCPSTGASPKHQPTARTEGSNGPSLPFPPLSLPSLSQSPSISSPSLSYTHTALRLRGLNYALVSLLTGCTSNRPNHSMTQRLHTASLYHSLSLPHTHTEHQSTRLRVFN